MTAFWDTTVLNTYGPNGHDVISLITTIHNDITIVEDTALALAAPGVMQDVPGAVVLMSALTPSREACIKEAMDKVHDAVSNGKLSWESSIVAGVTIQALVMRDLLSPSAYNLLTRPWCSVIGPVPNRNSNIPGEGLIPGLWISRTDVEKSEDLSWTMRTNHPYAKTRVWRW
jgi:hypothetical protein